MRTGQWVGVIGITLIGATLAAAQTSRAQPPKTPGGLNANRVIATRQNAFAVPFHVSQPDRTGKAPRRFARQNTVAGNTDPGNTGRGSAVPKNAVPTNAAPKNRNSEKIGLYVSTDKGVRWQLYDQQAADAGRFAFRAKQDGEYWFASKGVNPNQPHVPGTSFSPELRVLVDTVPPKLDFTATIGSSGEINARWDVKDESLSADSLRIDYRPAPHRPWRRVAVNALTDSRNAGQSSGEVSWQAPVQPSVISVRAEVRDRAGNSTVVQRRLNAAQPHQDKTILPVDTQPSAAITSPSANDRAQNQLPLIVSSPRRSGWQKDANGAWIRADSPVSSYIDSNRGRAVIGAPTEAEATIARIPAAGYRTQQEFGTISQTNGDRTGPKAFFIGAARPVERVYMPENQPMRTTKSRRFHLDYAAAAPGGEVVMWYTRDGGRSWEHVFVESGGPGRFWVEVASEGIYGFRFVNNNSQHRPDAQRFFDTWVNVDLERPSAYITSVFPRLGRNDHQVDISWTAHDRQLKQRPISLHWSDHPNGPWYPVARGLENTGSYRWQLGDRFGGRVPPAGLYLRLEAQDEAGNVTTHTLPQPVAINHRGAAAPIARNPGPRAGSR